MAYENVSIFGLSSSERLAKKVCETLKQPYGQLKVDRFADGEIKVTTDQTVRNKDVFIFQSTCYPVNDNIMELLIAIDMLKRSSAKSINVIIPYFGYARQDRKSSGREPISAKLVANMIETAGANKVVLMDIHSEQIQGFFDIPVDSLRAIWILWDAVNRHKKIKDAVLVSPDYGSVKRARRIAESINAPLAIVDKRRPRPNVSESINILGDVEGAHCVVVDDMIDTGGTILGAAKILKKKGAESVWLMATHGVFSGDAVERINKAVNDGIVNGLFVTDTICAVEDSKIKNLNVVSLAEFFADAIDAIVKSTSISKIYAKYSQKYSSSKEK